MVRVAGGSRARADAPFCMRSSPGATFFSPDAAAAASFSFSCLSEKSLIMVAAGNSLAGRGNEEKREKSQQLRGGEKVTEEIVNGAQAEPAQSCAARARFALFQAAAAALPPSVGNPPFLGSPPHYLSKLDLQHAPY